MPINSTAVKISWNALIISDISIDSYVVVYSQISLNDTNRNGEGHVMFNTTSGVITDLHVGVMYRFQVFATVKVGERILEGERSIPFDFTGEVLVEMVKILQLCTYVNSQLNIGMR